MQSHAKTMQLVIISKEHLKTPSLLYAAEEYVHERFLQKTNHARTKEGEFAITLAGMKNIQKAIDRLAKESDGKTAALFEDLQIPKGCKIIRIPKKAKEKEYLELEKLAISNI